MPHSQQSYNTLVSISGDFGLFRLLALLLPLGFVAGGCKQGGGPRPAQDAGRGAKKSPPPWARKQKKATTAPDESWIKDLKAISAREATRRYLTLSAAGDLTKIKPLVAQKCHKTPIGRVDATRAFKTRMKVTKVEVALIKEEGGEAKVKYQVTGDVSRTKSAETNILGKRVQSEGAASAVNGLTRTGVLTLRKIDDQWKLDCPKIKPIKPGFVGVKLRKNIHVPSLLHKHGKKGDAHGHKHSPPAKKAPSPK